jgi:hypothetical protein
LSLRGTIKLLILICALALVGCSAAPEPCNVETAQVDLARAEYEAALRAADAENIDMRQLDSELRALGGQQLESEDLSALEAKLAKLKRGSGR